ncbi:MAG: isochorismatase family protein [Methylosarcina sp.]
MNEKTSQPTKVTLRNGDVLIVNDIQKDFCPGGRLAVSEGDQVIPVFNRYIDHFVQRQLPVIATRCWHPKNHSSFIQQGGPWPEHCIAGSTGAEFADDLHLPSTAHIFSKGTEINNDGYSAFSNPGLKTLLDGMKTLRLFIGGLTTDYCVLNSVCDALDLGYQVMLLSDAVKAVNVHRQDGELAINKMILKGALPITVDKIQ